MIFSLIQSKGLHTFFIKITFSVPFIRDELILPGLDIEPFFHYNSRLEQLQACTPEEIEFKPTLRLHLSNLGTQKKVKNELLIIVSQRI